MREKVFNGYEGFTIKDSKLSFEKEEWQPKSRTNVVYIVLDDVGFAQLGCYGSNIHTPHINRLADEGLRYNNFHTTAICSATRASLLTGVNHHAAGVATVIGNYAGFPNQLGHINPSCATLAEILKEYGYATFAVGKWHLSPVDDSHGQGNVTYWPLQKGFDRYYGFLGGSTDQYHPSLVRDNTKVRQPRQPEEGYHLSADLSDQAIRYLYHHHLDRPEQPFFLYLAYGCGHCPHQAPLEYIDKYKGAFDDGWDVIRERWFARQKELGVIPQDANLTGRNPRVAPWESLSADEKKVYARYMEVFAGFLEYTDAQIGRVVDYIDSIGERDNTLIVLLSDNGASAGGGYSGLFVREKARGFFEETKEDDFQLALEHFADMGTEYSSEIYPAGWGHAGNTPFQWYKSWVHAGGIKDPLIIRYPSAIKDAGGIRKQYHHVSDITPAVLEAIGITKPAFLKGVPQKPFTGTSLYYTFADAQAASRKPVQYYEHGGNRGIWKDGWTLVANHALTDDYADDVWELYHTETDYSESENVAEHYPDKVEELKNLWFKEASANHVFPLGRGPHLLATKKRRREELDDRHRRMKEVSYAYENIIEPFESSAPLDFQDRSSVVQVTLDHRNDKAGTLYAVGNRFGGYTAFIRDNRLHFTYNYHMESYDTAVTPELPEGEVVIRVETEAKDPGGMVRLYVNGKQEATTRIKKMLQNRFWRGTVGSIKDGAYTSVDPHNKLPFPYEGEMKKIVFHAAPYEFASEEQRDAFWKKD